MGIYLILCVIINLLLVRIFFLEKAYANKIFKDLRDTQRELQECVKEYDVMYEKFYRIFPNPPTIKPVSGKPTLYEVKNENFQDK